MKIKVDVGLVLGLKRVWKITGLKEKGEIMFYVRLGKWDLEKSQFVREVYRD